jgi:hypothetical protein
MNFIGTEAAMDRRRTMTRAMPFLIGANILLSSCTVVPDYRAPAYAYDNPIYGSVNLNYGFDYGGWGGWHHGWDHGPGDLGHGAHGGWGHGFAGHAGFGGHGGHGGGHR